MVMPMRVVDEQHDDRVRLAQRRRTCQITPMRSRPLWALLLGRGPDRRVWSQRPAISGLLMSATRSAGPLRVSAAVSLTDALTTVAQQWEKAGNVHVELNFAASNILARQILEGAPVDVFISADESADEPDSSSPAPRRRPTWCRCSRISWWWSRPPGGR